MSRMFGVLLVAVGVVGLVFGGIAYRQQQEDVRFGSLVVEHTERHSLPIPPWAAAGALVAGAVLIAAPWRSRGSQH